VETDSGDISLEVAEGQAIKVEVTGEYDASKCDISAAISGSKLLASAKGKKKLFGSGGNCKAGFRITAPAGKKLVVRSGAGKIRIAGFSAGADVSSGAGLIEFKTVSGPITVKSGAGAVSGDIFTEALTVSTGAGSIDLAWNKLPPKGKVEIKTGAGKTTLSFPAGSKVHAVHTAGFGGMTNELGDDPASTFKIMVKSGAGSLNIKQR
jgi:DUF4097 and DUF4098 domain-containing protein YvlB